MKTEKHKVFILGNGSFGSCLRSALKDSFDILPGHESKDMPLLEPVSVILAVPLHAIESVIGWKGIEHHFVNVCSVQQPSIKAMCKNWSGWGQLSTSLHPLWGARTPVEHRNHILTVRGEHSLANDFIEKFCQVSKQVAEMTPEEHDVVMAKTHLAAVIAAKQMKVFVERAGDIPDEWCPNSFRLLKNFVKTLEDMPEGTITSIMGNPYG